MYMTDDRWPYPLHDRALDLGRGHRVQLYNVIAFSAGGPPSFGIQYGSVLPRADAEGRLREAEAVIRHFGPLFDERKAQTASAQVCGTPAQAETREPPEQIFAFERTAGGAWVCTGEIELPPSRPSA